MSARANQNLALSPPCLAVMIGRMIADGWRRLTVVTALIVLALAPFAVTAQAHPGHGHRAVAQINVAPSAHDHGDTGRAYAAPSQARERQAMLAERAKPAVSLIGIDNPTPYGAAAARADRGGDDPPEQSNCVGQCCGLGSACCGAALVLRVDELSTEFGGRPNADGAVTPLCAGIDPEALPEPPRSFV